MKHFFKVLLGLFCVFPTIVFTQQYEVMALGSAIVDYHIFVSEEEFAEVPGEKGSWQAVDFSVFQSLVNKRDSIVHPGESAMNLIRGLNGLGISCGVIGQAGPDEDGDMYIEQLKLSGIYPIFSRGTLPTGRSLCLVTPDGQRTMRTCIGAAHETNTISLSPKEFEGVRVFHIEGYQILDPDLILRSVQLARNAGVKISMDLGSAHLVRDRKEFIEFLIDKYVDILFANETEAQALTGLSPERSAEYLSNQCEIVVITMGEKGGIVQKGSELARYEAKPVKHTLDTTGAGDLFASGFLFGYLSNLPIKDCAETGTIIASRVVQRIGTRLLMQDWNDLKKQISEARF